MQTNPIIADDERPLNQNQDQMEKQISQLKHATWEFVYKQFDQEFPNEEFQWDFTKSDTIGKWNFTGSAKDKYGAWTCQGFLQFPIEGQIRFWMRKMYDNQEINAKGLQYKGLYDEKLQQFTGTWYYPDFETNPYNSGPWVCKQIDED